eukprot:TRINITY_DN7119_c0_g1_i1.p1 TRINITY_DN7119_c0_g1~~TRINITY_DN7119_c0_g1_i1.p1  ORF type:complete len:527 (-),score=78.20 TRINITY_DN7119_c0_g1_i1:123-1475(-)
MELTKRGLSVLQRILRDTKDHVITGLDVTAVCLLVPALHLGDHLRENINALSLFLLITHLRLQKMAQIAGAGTVKFTMRGFNMASLSLLRGYLNLKKTTQEAYSDSMKFVRLTARDNLVTFVKSYLHPNFDSARDYYQLSLNNLQQIRDHLASTDFLSQVSSLDLGFTTDVSFSSLGFSTDLSFSSLGLSDLSLSDLGLPTDLSLSSISLPSDLLSRLMPFENLGLFVDSLVNILGEAVQQLLQNVKGQSFCAIQTQFASFFGAVLQGPAFSYLESSIGFLLSVLHEHYAQLLVHKQKFQSVVDIFLFSKHLPTLFSLFLNQERSFMEVANSLRLLTKLLNLLKIFHLVPFAALMKVQKVTGRLLVIVGLFHNLIRIRDLVIEKAKSLFPSRKVLDNEKKTSPTEIPKTTDTTFEATNPKEIVNSEETAISEETIDCDVDGIAKWKFLVV